MTRVLFAVSGVDYWTLADGTRHPCGFWPEELAVPHEIFSAAGFDITIATPGAARPTADEAGFSAEMNGGSEEPGKRFRAYLDSIADALNSPADLDKVNATDYDLVFVPGGHGPMEDLAVSERFGALVGDLAAAGKPVAAVCHGPAALLPALGKDGTIYAPTSGFLTAIDPTDGGVKWERAMNTNLRTSVVVDPDGSLYVGGDNRMFAIDASGNELWHLDLNGNPSGFAIGRGAMLYVALNNDSFIALHE